ncbi:MAG: hypothetical protein ACP5PJ_02465 [Acidimicrobiales bacterium]
MGTDESARGASRIVSVVAATPGTPFPLSYRWPESFGVEPEVGMVVRIPLRGARVRGWIIEKDAPPSYEGTLLPVEKIIGYGPPPRLFAWCLSFAESLCCHPSYLLRHAMPNAPSRLGATLISESPGPPRVPFRPSLAGVAQLTLGWTPPDGSAVSDAVRFSRAIVGAGRSVIVVLPTIARAASWATAARAQGLSVINYDGGTWRSIRTHVGPLVVVGSRSTVFAPVDDLGGIVVIDHEDQSLRDTASPYEEVYDSARSRAEFEGAHVLYLSSAPRLEVLKFTKSAVGEVVRERKAWSRVIVPDEGPTEFLREGFSRLWGRLEYLEAPPGVARYARLAVIYNRKGFARRFRCRSCQREPLCDVCGTLLEGRAHAHTSPIGPNERASKADLMRQRNVVEMLWCPSCRATSPWRCAHCGSIDLVASAKGVSKIAAELEGLSGVPVLDYSRGGGDARFEAEIVVGTEALLYEDLAAHAVIFLDVDQLTASSSTDGTLKSLYLIGRALVATAQTGGQVLALTRRPRQGVLTAVRRGEVRSLYREELDARTAFGLPPARRFVLVSGAGADAFLEETQDLFGEGVEIFRLEDGTNVVSLPSEGTLPPLFTRRAQQMAVSDVKVEMLPRSL